MILNFSLTMTVVYHKREKRHVSFIFFFLSLASGHLLLLLLFFSFFMSVNNRMSIQCRIELNILDIVKMTSNLPSDIEDLCTLFNKQTDLITTESPS